MTKQELINTLNQYRRRAASKAHDAKLMGETATVQEYNAALAAYEIAISYAQDLDDFHE